MPVGKWIRLRVVYTLQIPGLVNGYIANWKFTIFLKGKSTISIRAIFNSYVKLPEGNMFYRENDDKPSKIWGIDFFQTHIKNGF